MYHKYTFQEKTESTNKIYSVVFKENSVAYYIRKYVKNVEDFKGIERAVPLSSKPGKLYPS